MAITAEMVKALRDRTGAGMMDCKTALTEANGDIDAAIDVLRKKGIAKAAKKAERGASDGVIATWLAEDQTSGLIAEINCETDFVARTDDFKALVQFVLDEAVKAGEAATEAWAKDPAGPIQPRVAQLVGKLGENMGVARIVRFAGRGIVGNYIHMGGKIGVLIELTGVTPSRPRPRPSRRSPRNCHADGRAPARSTRGARTCRPRCWSARRASTAARWKARVSPPT